MIRKIIFIFGICILLLVSGCSYLDKFREEPIISKEQYEEMQSNENLKETCSNLPEYIYFYFYNDTSLLDYITKNKYQEIKSFFEYKDELIGVNINDYGLYNLLKNNAKFRYYQIKQNIAEQCSTLSCEEIKKSYDCLNPLTSYADYIDCGGDESLFNKNQIEINNLLIKEGCLN